MQVLTHSRIQTDHTHLSSMHRTVSETDKSSFTLADDVGSCKYSLSFWTYVSSLFLRPFESLGDETEIASFSPNGEQMLGVSWLSI